MTDTATIIPQNIPIQEASLNDHIRRTADDLIPLLHNKTTPPSPVTPPSAKSVLLDIAKGLQQDTTPVLRLILEDQASSEGASISKNIVAQ